MSKYKYFIWDFDLGHYVPAKYLQWLMAKSFHMPCFRIPLFGYHSADFTGYI